MIIDTHSHCYWESLEPRIEEIVSNMRTTWVTQAVQIGCDIESSKKAIELARRFPGIFWATVWLHPETAQDIDINNTQLLKDLEELIRVNRDIVVAVGETGFDHHYLDETDGGKQKIDPNHLSEKALIQKKNQEYWWLEQWKLAEKYDLPLVIHTRDARDATLHFMKRNHITRCIMHCFSEDWDFARELLEFSDEIYFSFSGIVTYKSVLSIQEAAKKIPLDRILVETDAPFLAPTPLRWEINEPAYTRYTLEKIAELRGVSIDTIEPVLFENSRRVYGLDNPH